VHSAQRQVTRFRTQKAASLLAYLALHPSPQPRETVIDLFWPETQPDVGRHNLSNALSFLRHVLEPPGVPPGTVVLADRSSIRFNPDAVSTDVLTFLNTLRDVRGEELANTQRLEFLERAVSHYAGPLLPGHYEEWIVPEALRLEGLFVQAVIQLVPGL